MVRRLRLTRRPSNAVGYGKPPEHTQFKPGQSGNPKGRPKGSVNMATAFERALKEKVVVTEEGRRRRITKLDAAVKQLVNKAAMGDPRAIQLLLSLSKEGGVRSRAMPEPNDVAHEADQLVMKSLLKRMREYGKEQDDDADAG